MAGTGSLVVTPGSGTTINTLPPSGAATPANSLPIVLDTSVETAPGTAGTLAVSVQGNAAGIAVPVSAVALPLPAGGSTSALQTTGNTSLATIASNTPAVGQKASASSAPVVVASDQSPVPTTLNLSANANGQTSSRVNASATTNATSLKASAGNIARIDVFNVATYTVFLKLYNKASAPTVGTDTPVWTIPIGTGTGYSTEFARGKSFAAGIAYAITKLQADSDTTALAAGDVTGSIDWV